MMETKTYQSFSEFWPYYVSEHSKPGTRRLHFLGTSLGLLLLLIFFVTGPWWLVLLALISGYLFAWIGHFVVERNMPATFKYPLYSLAGDLKMFVLICVGKMEEEVKRRTSAR